MSKRYVLADLPRAGLGNRLLSWGRAVVFSHMYELPLMVRGWSKFSVGPWLRNEKSKRLYGRYFRSNDNLANRFYEKIIGSGSILDEPSFDIDTAELQKYKVIRFNKTPHWVDYFEHIKEFRPLIKKELQNYITPSLLKDFARHQPPVIGVHVRMGDFRPLQPGEDFKKVGLVRTPIEYFKDCILEIRKLHGSDLPVTIFSNGRAHELRLLLDMPNTRLVEDNPDIIDLLMLSESRVIIASAGSTFSYWAGFLSDVPLIMHPDHIHKSIRSSGDNLKLYEGPLDLNNSLLRKSILDI
jgi:hypothetical protein